MTPERDNPILDAFLEEALGGVRPPDLSGRILAAWRSGASGTSANGAAPSHPLPPPVTAPVGVVPSRPLPVAAPRTAPSEPVALPSITFRGSAGQPVAGRGRWVVPAVAAALAVTVACVGLWMWHGASRPSTPGAGDVAAGDRSGESDKPGTNATRNKSNTNIAGHPQEVPDRNISPEDGGMKVAPPDAAGRSKLAGDAPGAPLPRGGTTTHPPAPPAATVPWTAPVRSLPPGPASSNAELAAFIGDELGRAWNEQGVKPSPPATDSEWCRRVYLRVLGRIPTVNELNVFVASRQPDKRAQLVDQLLNSDKYVEEYARNWSTIWANILIGRSGGAQPGDTASREGLLQFLRQSFQRNDSFRDVAHELIAATGDPRPGSEGYNGAATFVLSGLGDDATLATARTSRVFLGIQLQCAQCHNHPWNEWKQSHFWEMNAFFRQARPERVPGTLAVRLANVDFKGETGNSDEAEVYFEERNGQMRVAYPAFVDGTRLPRSGKLAVVDRRRALADLVVSSEHFPRAIANRAWAHFWGYGFTNPVDDLGAHNAPSHPELLDRLGREFAAHDYDLKRLIQWIVLSEPFGVSSRITLANTADMPDAGSTPLFSRYYTRQMRAEELYDSLQVAAGMAHARSTTEQDKARAAFLGQLTMNLQTDEGEETTLDGTIPQALMMMNGELIQRATSGQKGTLLHAVSASNMPFGEKLDHLFMAAVARKPTRNEAKVAEGLLAARKGDAASALQDIWWALLNSNEFILDH